MSCRTHYGALVDLARGLITQPATGAAEAHAASCARCAALFERERRLTSGLQALARATRVPPTDDIERRLIDAFESLHAAEATARRTRRWVRRAAVAAAVCGVGVGLSVLTLNRRPGAIAPSALHVGAPQVAGAPEAGHDGLDARAGESTAPRPVQAASRLRKGVHRAGPAHAGPRAPSPDFVPLPGARALPDFESGQVFRVHLPVGVLPAYGLEISPTADGEPVTADVLVGQDGQARAIRLVTVESQTGSRR